MCHTAQVGQAHSNMHVPQYKTQSKHNVMLGTTVMPDTADVALKQNNKI
jgi:hypothetical protein